jgi:preprotein translocase subunit SecD
MHATLTAEEVEEKGVPPGYRIVVSADGVFKVLVREPAAITGGDLADAKPGVAPGAGVPIIELVFTAAGAPKLADLTTRNIGRALAIVVGGRLLSAPIVRTPILKGKLYIEGNLTPDSAAQLARSMRSPSCAG